MTIYPGGNAAAAAAARTSNQYQFQLERASLVSAPLPTASHLRELTEQVAKNNYGFLVNNVGSIGTKAAPIFDPFDAGVVHGAPLDPSLAAVTDVYFDPPALRV